MISLGEIRKDLKEIRYYYSRKEMFDKAFKEVASNVIYEKVCKYNEAVKYAPPQLFDLYISLYVKGMTQEVFAYEFCYTPEHIQRLNKKLLFFLQSKLVGG